MLCVCVFIYMLFSEKEISGNICFGVKSYRLNLETNPFMELGQKRSYVSY